MSILVRKAESNDVPFLEKLLADYIQETYQGEWGGSVELLKQHITEKDIEILLAESSSQEIVGFLAWSLSYDLHWCMKGGIIVDLYVASPYRSRGIAVLLAVSLANEIHKCGGTHLKGGAVENLAVNKLYQRIAMSIGGNEYNVSGRAFRHLASLFGQNLREIAKNLPKTEWNYEP